LACLSVIYCTGGESPTHRGFQTHTFGECLPRLWMPQCLMHDKSVNNSYRKHKHV